MPEDGLMTGKRFRLSSQDRAEIAAIEVNAGRCLQTKQTAHGRKHINQSSGLIRYETALNRSRPIEDSRHTNASVPVVPFLSPKSTDSVLEVAAVIRTVDNERVFCRRDFLEFSEQTPNRAIRVVDRPRIDRPFLLQFAIFRNDSIWSRNRSVRLVKPDVEKKRSLLITICLLYTSPSPRDAS